MAQQEGEIVGVKVILKDGSEFEPLCWALAFVQYPEQNKPYTGYSWSRREESTTDIVALGVAIETLVSEYNRDPAIRGAITLLQLEGKKRDGK